MEALWPYVGQDVPSFVCAVTVGRRASSGNLLLQTRTHFTLEVNKRSDYYSFTAKGMLARGFRVSASKPGRAMPVGTA